MAGFVVRRLEALTWWKQSNTFGECEAGRKGI
jgi:hypothetical protein